MPPSNRPGDQGNKYYLLDNGYEAGEQFCRALLMTGEFGQQMLTPFAGRGRRSGAKSDLTANIAGRIANVKDLEPEPLVLAFCKQPRRQWLCVRRGIARAAPKEMSAYEFLTERSGEEVTWYGPFGDGDRFWYIIAKNVSQNAPTAPGEVLHSYPLRWHVIVEVAKDYAAFHWNGFTQRQEESVVNQKGQYPYWRFIPGFFKDLEDKVGAEYDAESPNLMEIILHGSFTRYGESDVHNWKHKRIRATYETVALNASGGSGRDRGMDEDEKTAFGLQILTGQLAETALAALGKGGDDVAKTKVDRAILRMILHRWGTKSYEFILEQKLDASAEEAEEPDVDDDDDGAEDGEPRPTSRHVRMHIYFGVDSGSANPGQDSLQHVHCYANYGGTTRSLDFILEEEQKEATRSPATDGVAADDEPRYDGTDDDDDAQGDLFT